MIPACEAACGGGLVVVGEGGGQGGLGVSHGITGWGGHSLGIQKGERLQDGEKKALSCPKKLIQDKGLWLDFDLIAEELVNWQ